MSAFASECLFNVSVCFHAEALSNNHTLKVAHSPALSYRRYYTSHYNLPFVGREWEVTLFNKV